MCKIKEIKNSLVDYLYTNMETFNICDMGEIIDMIKDLEQAMYYKAIIEVMESNDEEEKNSVLDKITTIPE